MKTKIITNGISLLSPLTGIGRYTYEISKIIKDKRYYNTHYFYAYHSKTLIEPSQKSHTKNLKSLLTKVPLIKRIVRRVLFSLDKFFLSKYTLYWEPNFIPNPSIHAQYIVTSVHDFSAILYRSYHPKERIEYFEKYFFENITKSDIIITGSEFTKQEIIQRLHFHKDKIKVIPHGINKNTFKVKKDCKIDINLPKQFIFCVGSIEPRKNLLGLLNAYNILDASIKEKYKLVLAGFKGWENKEIMQLIEKNKTHIHYLGYVSDDELATLYNLASLFVYPSFYEGFGLPPLEAMACGTPVITSNTSSLPEVGGDAVVYCNPHDIEDIKAQITKVLNNSSLQKEMTMQGLVRAQGFTWEKSAQLHMEVFESLIKNENTTTR